MSFSILDYIDTLEETKESGKYICPACEGDNLSINKETGGYNCWNDPSPEHRAEIRNILSPMVRWEKPSRDPGTYTFPYKSNGGKEVVIVHRHDTTGNKRIWQDFPTLDQSAPDYKLQLQETKSSILPYQYEEAIAESNKTGLPIVVVEGELTCQAVWAIGLPCVTFLGGSKQYRTNADYSQMFRNYKLVLAPDRDEQGIKFMREIEADNPGSQWLYAEPSSWEWDNLPAGHGFDLADYIEEGITKEELLASIVSNGRHSGKDGKPSYEEIIGAIELFVGLYNSDSRIIYETNVWLEQHGIKMSQQNIDKIIEDARSRVYGKDEIRTVDALEIVQTDQCREWVIAGIMPLGSVMLLAASGGTGKSTLIYNWALNIALGQPWSGRRCIKGKSLIIQSDEPLVDTSEKLGVIGFQEAGLEPGTVAFWENWRFGHMQQLEDYVRKHRPVFIAIDSLTACLAGMDVDLVKSNAGDVLYGLRDIANKYKCSIALLHHLNKSGGLRDSTSFVDNVSEVVKLTKPENNHDPNQFHLEWLKSRSGLTGKHVLQRDPLNYGWGYTGPIGGSLEELDQCVNIVLMRKTKRLTRQQVAALTGKFDVTSTGKMLEIARRQGLIKGSFQDGPNGEKTRLYQSFDYEEPAWDADDNEGMAVVDAAVEEQELVSAHEKEPDPIVTHDKIDPDEWF
jgi:hypothetical protein